MAVQVWIRARSGPALGIGHRVRALILAKALKDIGVHAGLIFDADAPDASDELTIFRLADRARPPTEATAYPNDTAPVILDLSHPSMLDQLPALVRQLKQGGRKVGLIDGLGREAYCPSDSDEAADVVLTPYVLEPEAPKRSASTWLHGAEFAVLDPVYSQAPAEQALERGNSLLVFISGTDPWHLTEATLSALIGGGLPQGWTANIVAGPGFDTSRRSKLASTMRGDPRFSLLNAPPTLREALVSAKLAILGPGLAKYEAAACGTFSLIASPELSYAQMNAPFAAEGLATVLSVGPPKPLVLCEAILAAGARSKTNPRALIDGAGARRAAERFVSELFTESGDG